MLEYAFEHPNCIAVEIRTDFLNTIPRNAIERLGAKKNDASRYHKIMKEGKIRNTVCYSIIQPEWNKVKDNLLHKILYYEMSIIKSNN